MSETDYTTIKQDLKNFLRNHSDFTDYDFDGSALTSLIEILAYNAQNLALQSNLVFAETFLDSANQRSSIVSRAKELGYVPRSSSAAIANITMSFSVTGNPSQYIIPKYTKFISTGENSTIQFVNVDDISINNLNNVFTSTFDIVQGKIVTYRYTVNTLNLNQKFIIPSKTVDLQYLSVVVNGENYIRFENYNIGDIDGNSLVYYIHENIDGYYEITFGDAVLGKEVVNGSVIDLTYLKTEEIEGNSLSSFLLSNTLAGVSSVSIVTNNISQGGAERESIDSIKFTAPLSYQSQNRTVSKYDYISIIKKSISGIEDVNVWGGEDNDPPYYGKVFVALKPFEGKYISNTAKERIKNIIKTNYSVVSIRPEIVDPEYTDVGVEATIIYSGKKYNPLTNTNLTNTIKSSIIDFFNKYGNKFGETIYHSGVVDAIKQSSNLILSTSLNFVLTKYSKVSFGISDSHIYKFNNYVTPNTVRSNTFTIDGYEWSIKDIPSGSYPFQQGVLAVYREVGNVVYYHSVNIGTVNYITGEVSISNLLIDSMNDLQNELLLSINPGSYIDEDTVFTDYNIYTNSRDQLIRLNEDQITITLLVDNTK